MDIPMVPRAQVQAMIRYRLPDPLQDMLLEYAEFLGRPFAEVQAEYSRLVETDFAELLGPDIHLLSLMVAPLQLEHLFTRLQVMLGFAMKFHGAGFLDIGAGAGRDCIAFARCGFRTTHADIPWEGMDLARWRYTQRRLNIRCVDVRDLPKERFTVIGCHDVFEHVTDPVELMARFATHLEPGGLLCTSLDLFNPIPTHRAVNDFYATLYDPLLKLLGLELVMGHTSPVADVSLANMRIYGRTRPITLSVEDEYRQNCEAAYAFAQQELQQLSARLNEELELVTASHRQKSDGLPIRVESC